MMPILGAGRVGFYIVANRPGVRLLAGRPVASTFTNAKPNPSAEHRYETNYQLGVN